jgi:uncharacterized protein (DUF1778 family)
MDEKKKPKQLELPDDDYVVYIPDKDYYRFIQSLDKLEEAQQELHKLGENTKNNES